MGQSTPRTVRWTPTSSRPLARRRRALRRFTWCFDRCELPRRRIPTASASVYLGMSDSDVLYDAGRFDTPHLAFLETIATLRPSLHRYCARMTGSVADGEDVVQEALFHAYRRLHSFDHARPLQPRLFR